MANNNNSGDGCSFGCATVVLAVVVVFMFIYFAATMDCDNASDAWWIPFLLVIGVGIYVWVQGTSYDKQREVERRNEEDNRRRARSNTVSEHKQWLEQHYDITNFLVTSSGTPVYYAVDRTKQVVLLDEWEIPFSKITNVVQILKNTSSSYTHTKGDIDPSLVWGAHVSANSHTTTNFSSEVVGLEVFLSDLDIPKIEIYGNESFCEQVYASLNAVMSLGVPASPYARICSWGDMKYLEDHKDEIEAAKAAEAKRKISDKERPELANASAVAPVKISDTVIMCPVCRKRQSPDRTTCFNCGKMFLTQ